MSDAQNLINVVDPDTQQVGSIPAAQLPDAMEQGFTEASPEQVDSYVKQQKYGSLPQQAITGLEGAASAGTFGLSTGLEKNLLNVKPEDIQGRREANPLTHIAGQVAGIAGSSALLPGGGAAGVLDAAGEGAKALAGIGEGSALAKIGSAAVKNAAETALFQGGDEVSKMFSEDPGQSVQTAAINLGLSGILGAGVGAGLGAVSPLWNATMGSKVGQILKGISDRMGGVESQAPDALADAVNHLGVSLSPEVRAGLSSSPELRQMFQTLQESTTAPGQEAQQALKNFKSQLGESALSALGKTPEDVARLADVSEFELGSQLKSQMVKDIESTVDPLSKRFEEIKSRFADAPVSPSQMDKMAERIGNLIQEKGYNLSDLSPESGVAKKVLQEIPKIQDLQDLTKYQTLLNNSAKGRPELFDVVRNLRGVLREGESDIIADKLSRDAPELLDTFAKARLTYGDNMEFLDSLNDRLHVGRFNGPGTFLNNLKEMRPEDLLRRMEGKRDVELFQKYSLNSWQGIVKDWHLSQVLKGAVQKAGEGELLSTKALFTNLEKMSPELRSVLMTPESQAKLDSIKTLLEAIPSKMNTSGTAKTLDSLWSHLPGSAIGLATLMTGHNPATALIVGGLTKWLGRDVPDAARLGLLKFLGSNQPLEAEGFKSMVDFIHHLQQGESALNKSMKGLVRGGGYVLPESFLPSEKQKEKLDKKIEQIQANPESILTMGGKTGHYLPDHAEALGEFGARAVQYLSQIKPRPKPTGPLDKPIEPTKAEKVAYDRALTIAEQPLSILKPMKDGTLLPQDVISIKTMYPDLYQRMSQKMISEITTHVSKEESIPYKTRLSMSLFLGQPLSATMSAANIQLSQSSFQQAQAGSEGQMRGSHHSTKGLMEMASSLQTPSQAREAQKSRSR